jgi:copper chaperone
MSCDHCRVAIAGEVSQIAGVIAVDVDLAALRVTVTGDGFEDAAVRSAIDDAGYDVA